MNEPLGGPSDWGAMDASGEDELNMRNMTSLRAHASKLVVLLGLASSVGSLGCGGQPGDVGPEGTTTVSAALDDASGTIHSTIQFCSQTFYSGSTHSAFCDFGGTSIGSQGEVLVGGGVDLGGQTVPGALLVGSKLLLSPRGWYATAKDHILPSPYSMRAAVIGVRLDAVAPAVLSNSVHIDFAYSPNGHREQATISVRPGDIVLGGGANCTSVSGGDQQLMVASKPFPDSDGSTPTGWTAVCKDHELSSIGFATAYVISIPRCISGRCFASTTSAAQTRSITSGYDILSMCLSNVALTGVGGEAITLNGDGRLLSQILPYNTGTQNCLEVQTKDHQRQSGGYTRAYMIRLTPA